MTVKVIPDDYDENEYNKRAIHPLQSWEWGEARKKMGIAVIRIGEFEKEALKNVFQVTFHKIPYTPFTIGYLPRSTMPSKYVLNMLMHEGKQRRSIFIKIEPYVHKNETVNKNLLMTELVPTEVGTQTSSHHANFVKLVFSKHPLFPKWTQMIDLAKSETELLKNMHPKTRYNIRLAQKKGVVVKEMTNNQGFAFFSRLYFDTCRRQGYRGHTEEYHKIVFEALKKNIAHILIAFYKDTPLSAYELFIFNDVSYYLYGGSSEEMKNVMAANLLMWEAMRFGKSHGVKIFDLWGSLPPDYDRDSAWGGFTRFKEGYGGKFVEFTGSYDLIINHYIYSLYNVVYKIRQKYIIARPHS